jgi:hypothetical protein
VLLLEVASAEDVVQLMGARGAEIHDGPPLNVASVSVAGPES